MTVAEKVKCACKCPCKCGGNRMGGSRIQKHISDKFRGNRMECVCFYILFILSGALFLLSAIGIIGQLGETISTVEVTLKDEIPMPAIWACVPDVGGFPELSALPMIDDCITTDVPSFGAITHTGFDNDTSRECFWWAFSDRQRDLVRIEEEAQFLRLLRSYLKTKSNGTDWHCAVGNMDGTAKSFRDRPAHIDLLVLVHEIPQTKATDARVFMGLFDPKLSGDLQAVMEENNQIFLGNIINAINNMKIQYDHVTDSRHLMRIGVETVDSMAASQPKSFALYSAMNSVTQIEHVPGGVKSGSLVYFKFELSSFVSRDIVLRQKYITEVVSEIGGAWASAMLLLTIFFYDEYQKHTKFRLRVLENKNANQSHVQQEFKADGPNDLSIKADGLSQQPKSLTEYEQALTLLGQRVATLNATIKNAEQDLQKTLLEVQQVKDSWSKQVTRV